MTRETRNRILALSHDEQMSLGCKLVEVVMHKPDSQVRDSDSIVAVMALADDADWITALSLMVKDPPFPPNVRIA